MALIARIVFAAALAAGTAAAQETTLEALEARGARKLDGAAVRSLLVSRTIDVGTGTDAKSWETLANGTLAGGLDGKNRQRTHSGVWRMDDDRYCVVMDWGQSTDQWCRSVWKAGEALYFVGQRKGEVVAIPFALR